MYVKTPPPPEPKKMGPRTAMAYGYFMKGYSRMWIARRMECSYSTVRTLVKLGKEIATGRRTDGPRHFDWERHPVRCRCGLVMPCNSCVPTIYAFAASRRGEAGGDL